MSCNTSRIAVLMLNSPAIQMYGHLAAYINYKYSTKHGYTFIVERCPRKQDMKKDWMWDEKNQYVVVWSKPTLVRRHLPHYDYVFFIDSDAVFLNQEQKIEHLIKKYIGKDKDVCIVSGEDCYHQNMCWDKKNLNTGAMLFVNRPKTLQILDHWLKAADGECSNWKYQHTREQMCLQILKNTKYNKHIKTIPYQEINGLDGKWVRHYMFTSTEERMKLFNQHFQDFFGQECRNFYTSMSPKLLAKENYSHLPRTSHVVSFACLSCLIILIVILTMIGLKTTWFRRKK